MTRLGQDTDYKRPKRTYQDKLTLEEIKEKLEDYVEVEDISNVMINTHLRYFAIKKNKKTGKKRRYFRLGGFLINNKEVEKYIVLSTSPISIVNENTKTWSVDTNNNIFYRKMTKEEIKRLDQEEMDELYDEIHRLSKENKKLKSKLEKDNL